MFGSLSLFRKNLAMRSMKNTENDVISCVKLSWEREGKGGEGKWRKGGKVSPA